MRALNGMITPEKEIESVLTASEKIEYVFKMPLESLVFTNKRLVIFDFSEQATLNHGCHSLPYQNITCFSMVPFDEGMLKYKLKIWMNGTQGNIEKIFDVDSEFEKIHKILADFVLNKNPTIIDKEFFMRQKQKKSTARLLGVMGLTLASIAGAKYFKKMHHGKHKKSPIFLMLHGCKQKNKKQENNKVKTAK